MRKLNAERCRFINGLSFTYLLVYLIFFIFIILNTEILLVNSTSLKVNNSAKVPPSKAPEVGAEEEEVQSLYVPSEPILQLNQGNFDQNIYNVRKAFFVEFYSSWCGHCVNFAPTFSAFARQVVQWQSIVEIAAVNCALESNFVLCQNHNVEVYPSLRYFRYESSSANDSEKFKGSKQTADALSYGLVKMIYEDWLKNKPPKWPNLDYENDDSTIAELWSGVEQGVQFLSIVVENNITKFAGVHLKLEFYEYQSKVAVKVVTNNSYVAQTYSLTASDQLPALILMKRGIQTPYFVSKKALTSLDEAVKKILYHTELVMVNKTAQRVKQVEIEKKKKSEVKIDPKMKSRYFIHKSDLLSSLRYSWHHEIGKFKKISGQKLKILQNFMEIVLRYFPSNIQEKRYLFDLTVWLNGIKDEMDNKMWENKLDHLQSQYGNAFPLKDKWVSCKGSKPRFRNYPCSLWTLFHTLTVFAYKMDGSTRQFDPKELIKSFQDFTREFFGCEECAQNFQRETAKLEEEVVKPQDVVLYLWRVHNKVNLRIKGTMTEDPAHPKEQFPIPALCSVCFNSRKNVWNEDKVFEFLLQFYTDIKTDGLPDPNEMIVDNPDVNGGDPDLSDKDNSNSNQPLNFNKDRKHPKFNHLRSNRFKTDDDSMNSFDFSLCLLLWILSSFIVLFLFVFFKTRRNNKYKCLKSYLKF